MPELPEVETVRRGLVPIMIGRTLTRVDISDERLVRPRTPREVMQQLTGRRIVGLDRRGKYLLIELDDDTVAVHHLRMTGSFAGPSAPPVTHVRLQYFLDDEELPVRYRDPRRFGTLEHGAADEQRARLDARLGPEPFDARWNADYFGEQIARRRAPIKAVLLDQRVVAGLGNIYVDEVCMLAGVRPTRVANTLSRREREQIVVHVRSRLLEAIEFGGSTLRDYRAVAGEVGGMQERFVAYGRVGKPCLRCGTVMVGAVVAGRSTSWCPQCQK
jgi:formamidopyrimidine-DNA glycosylase